MPFEVRESSFRTIASLLSVSGFALYVLRLTHFVCSLSYDSFIRLVKMHTE
jgi:hypothetical protein